MLTPVHGAWNRRCRSVSEAYSRGSHMILEGPSTDTGGCCTYVSCNDRIPHAALYMRLHVGG